MLLRIDLRRLAQGRKEAGLPPRRLELYNPLRLELYDGRLEYLSKAQCGYQERRLERVGLAHLIRTDTFSRSSTASTWLLP